MNILENTDIHRVTIDNREFVLVGTAHISQESVETVKAVIQGENESLKGGRVEGTSMLRDD